MTNSNDVPAVVNALDETPPDTAGLEAPAVVDPESGLLPDAARAALSIPSTADGAVGRVWRFTGDASFPSGWSLTPTALRTLYGDVAAEDLGSVRVLLPNGDQLQVRDMHYDLGDGQVGMHLIPVDDNDTPDSYAEMDEYLRRTMYGPAARADAAIFTLTTYVHPEKHSGKLSDLGESMLKTEMGATHMGAYLGRGVTSNSPEEYHERRWYVGFDVEEGEDRGYPANVQVVSLEGVDQETLNRNALLCDQMLNKGVLFPDDYKNDKYRLIDLNSVLMFYRDWIRSTAAGKDRRKGTKYLTDDSSWHTYCAEHKTSVVNVMLNLPHHEASFIEVYGPDEGPVLWRNFTDRYNTLNPDDPWSDEKETHFAPLWKQEGVEATDIRPFENGAQYEAYHNALTTGTLDAYGGPTPLAPGVALAWPPETTADLVNDFLETYASFVDVGAPICASVLMAFREKLVERMGITDEKFLRLAIPIINKMMVAEAMVEAPGNPTWLDQATAQLYAAFGGNPADLSNGPDAMRLAVVEKCLYGARQALPGLQAGAATPRSDAYAWLKRSTQTNLEEARHLAVAEAGLTAFYSPPAVAHRVSIGMHERNRRVSIRTVCTAVERSHVTAGR